MSFCLNPHSSDFSPPFSLHDPNVRMPPPPPTCLSVCPIPHISTRDRALKDISTFTVSKPPLLLLSSLRRGGVWVLSMLCFYP